MFRKMRRFRQELSREDCLQVLERVPRGVLSVLGDDGYPYGVPMDFWYCREDGNFYFHGAGAGHKLDAIDRCEKASFCVFDQGWREEGQWALHIRSVIAFGKMSRVTDAEKAKRICLELGRRFTEDEAYLAREIEKDGKRVQCLMLETEHMTGKQVRED